MDHITLVLILVDRHKGLLQRGSLRGILVSDEWRGVKGREAFVRWSLSNGFSPELELDRRRPNEGYTPENCQWITRNENLVKDKRTIEYEGGFYTLKELHRKLESPVNYNTVVLRRNYGWELIEALMTPSNRGNRWR